MIDSPQSLIAEQVAAGLVVRMAILYELLAGGDRTEPGAERRAARRRRPRSGSPREPRRARSTCAPARARTWSCAAPRVLDPVAGIDGAHDVVIRDGAIAELAAPGARRRRTAPRWSRPRACTPSPPSSTPTSTCARPGQEHKEDIETGTRAAAAGGYCGILAMANTEPPVSDRRRRRGPARARPRRGLGPGRLPRHRDARAWRARS